jgi:hypothetical protein
MVQNGFPIRLILTSLIALGGPAVFSRAQDDDAPPRMTEAKAEKSGTFSSALGKMFGRKDDSSASDSQTKPSESARERDAAGPSMPGQSVPGKPSFGFSRERTVPAQTTGNRGGGIFVPLRSFTNRVFRANEDQDLNAIRVKATTDYENTVTQLENMARNRAEASAKEQTADEESSLNDDDSNELNSNGTSGTEVGSALRTNQNPKTPAPKANTEPFSNTKSNPSPTRSSNGSEKQTATSLPPPPPLIPSPRTNQTKSVPAPFTAPNNISNSTRSTTTAPIVNGIINLEEKSTSRRTPVGSSGITESLDLPDGRSNKPANLLDLSSEGNTPLPTSIQRPRSTTSGANLSSDTRAGAEPFEKGSDRTDNSSVDSSAKEPTVIRNRVPELRSEQPTSALPKISVGSQDAPQEKTPTAPREPVGVNSGSLLELKQPGISINIAGPNAMVVGQETVYELIAKNHGNTNLNGLIVRVSLPNSVVIGNSIATSGSIQPDREDGDNAILWEVETISAGQTQSLKLPMKTASPEHFAMNVEWTALPQSQSLQVKVQEPKLDLALEGPAEAEYGVPIKYRLRIKNPGNAVAKTVEVRLAAESFGSNQSVVGDIAPGAERIIDVELLFEQSGSIPILATATSTASNVQSQSQIEVRVRQAKLAAKWVGPTSYYQGSVGDYQIIFNNEGDAAINQAKLSVNIPNGAEPVALPPGSVRRGNSVQWDVKKLMPGESVTVPLRFTFSQLGQTELVLQAESKNAGSVVATHSITVDAVEDLKLAVVPPVAPAPTDQPVPYEIEIHNRGTKAARNVSVLAQFSEGVEPVKVEGHSGQIVPGQVVFESIPSIGPNERIVLKVFVQANSSGIHRFRAEVKGTSGEVDLVQEGSTRYMASGVQPQLRR